MKLKRSTIIPLALLVYLAVMAYIGYPEYAAGNTSALSYFGTIVATLLVLVLLHLSLKRREKLKAERLADIERNEKTEKDN